MFYAAVTLAAGIPLALGLLVVVRSRVRRIGWLLAAHGVSVALRLGGSQQAPGVEAGGSPTGTAAGGGMLVVDQLAQGSWIFLFLWLVLVAYLVPDGRLPSVRWRRWVWGGALGVVLFLVGAAGDADSFRQEHQGQPPPLRWLPGAISDVVGVIGLALVVILFFGSVVAVRGRLRGSTGDTRLQLLWLVWGTSAVPIGLMLVWANHFLLGEQEWVTTAALTLVSVALPVAIAIAILRHRLFDIRVVLSRTITYGVLTLVVITVYALLLLVAERLGGSGTTGGLVAVAVVAVAVHPVHSWLRRRVERLVYGYRSEPRHALRLLADQAEAAEPGELGASITEAVREALRLDHVWMEPGDDRGHDDDAVRSPLVHRGESLGALAVRVPRGRQLSAADLSLLHDLARYAAVLVRSERQGDQLRESRARIVASREEERRRLRRDLHDGIGPSLAAIVLKLNAAQSAADEDRRSVLMAEARGEVRETIAEIRRLVDDLRPAAIDEVGLVAAIRQRAAALSGEVAIEVSGPEAMPALPAAVEVAAFRIASEAMANVVRHSGATGCRVAIAVNGAFELTVADNGHGIERSGPDGVGWRSMQERAAELGGSCTISGRHPEAGVVVRAVLPFGPRVAGNVDMESRT